MFELKTPHRIGGIWWTYEGVLTRIRVCGVHRFFKESTWPSEETIAPLVNHGTSALLHSRCCSFFSEYSVTHV